MENNQRQVKVKEFSSKITTPCCIYQTYKGSIANLTPDHQKLFPFELLSLYLGDFVEIEKILNKLDEDKFSLRKYLGFQENQFLQLSPIGLQEDNCIKGCNQEDQIKIKTGFGYRFFTIKQYIKYMKIIKPNILVSLTESPDQEKAGKKSYMRCKDKSLKFLDQIISETQSYSEPLDINIFVPIQGAEYEQIWKNSVKEACTRDIQGLTIQGLFTDSFDQNYRKNMLNATFDSIPENQKNDIFVSLSSEGEPVDIVQGVLAGIDFFETVYPFKLSNQGKAIYYNTQNFISIENSENLNIDEQMKNKRQIILDIKEKKFEKQFSKIVENCTCYTCMNHTIAYIHHLLICKEMTAFVLLTIHNICQYEQFFCDLRKAINNNQIQQFISQYLLNLCKEIPESEKKRILEQQLKLQHKLDLQEIQKNLNKQQNEKEQINKSNNNQIQSQREKEDDEL